MSKLSHRSKKITPSKWPAAGILGPDLVTFSFYSFTLKSSAMPGLSDVPYGDKVLYHCTNGMKSATNLAFDHLVATCNPGNVWTPPAAWESWDAIQCCRNISQHLRETSYFIVGDICNVLWHILRFEATSMVMALELHVKSAANSSYS